MGNDGGYVRQQWRAPVSHSSGNPARRFRPAVVISAIALTSVTAIAAGGSYATAAHKSQQQVVTPTAGSSPAVYQAAPSGSAESPESTDVPDPVTPNSTPNTTSTTTVTINGQTEVSHDNSYQRTYVSDDGTAHIHVSVNNTSTSSTSGHSQKEAME